MDDDELGSPDGGSAESPAASNDLPQPDELPDQAAGALSAMIPDFFASITPIPDFIKQLRGGPGSMWPNLAAVVNFAAISRAAVPEMGPRILRSLTSATHSFASMHPEIAALATFKAPAFEWPDFAGAFAAMFERLRDLQPPNWSEDIDESKALAVIGTDGIPLVWVPRAEIVDAVLAAPDRKARLELLVKYRHVVADDCREVLGRVTEKSLTGRVPLAVKAVDALAAGHFEAAQALAVVVAESAIARAISDKYQTVKKQVLFDPKLFPYSELRLRAALLPISGFYTDWSPESPRPMPEGLSRHVSVHHADVEHYTEQNAVVAVLLVTSVLRALQELEEIAAAYEAEVA